MQIQQLFIHFEQGGQEKISFLVLLLKMYTKVKMSTKKCSLVFSFSFWFQFIQRIEQ